MGGDTTTQDSDAGVNAWGFIMHEVGEVFIDNNHDGQMAHVVARVDSDPLPTDEDAPSYEARCGIWGFGYSMGGVAMSTFIARNAADVDPAEVNCCPVCFRS